MLQNGGSVINDARIENSATYEHDPEDIPRICRRLYAQWRQLRQQRKRGAGGRFRVIVQSGEAHITNGGMINSDGSALLWRRVSRRYLRYDCQYRHHYHHGQRWFKQDRGCGDLCPHPE
ncbi:hypothetical protein JT305_21255 [Salmonella enterica subsp. enterica serovar Senftenberg]|nr:hypothetical protein [Salmonella enterica subsp. enterica serovar Senftenberg]